MIKNNFNWHTGNYWNKSVLRSIVILFVTSLKSSSPDCISLGSFLISGNLNRPPALTYFICILPCATLNFIPLTPTLRCATLKQNILGVLNNKNITGNTVTCSKWLPRTALVSDVVRSRLLGLVSVLNVPNCFLNKIFWSIGKSVVEYCVREF